LPLLINLKVLKIAASIAGVNSSPYSSSIVQVGFEIFELGLTLSCSTGFYGGQGGGDRWVCG
jgi:hypothetical protein